MPIKCTILRHLNQQVLYVYMCGHVCVCVCLYLFYRLQLSKTIRVFIVSSTACLYTNPKYLNKFRKRDKRVSNQV